MDETREQQAGRQLTVKEAAEQMPGGAVTEQYISFLCRGGRIKAEKRGRQWFVDPESLANYTSSAGGRNRISSDVEL